MIHHLTDRQPASRRASCSVCGPVKMQRSGTGWVCATKGRANSRAWKRRNPDRDRGGRSEHELVGKARGARVCAKCGPVATVPVGRGVMCANRAIELGRVNHQDAPQRPCPDCLAADGTVVYPTDGECRRCEETDLGAELARAAADERLLAGVDDWAEAGLQLVGAVDPYAMPDYESAVPGWRTLPTEA